MLTSQQNISAADVARRTADDGVDLDSLISQVDSLLAELADVDREREDVVMAAHPTHRSGVANLQHYAHLRSRDFRVLQIRLEQLGVMTAAENNVRDQLLATRNLLGTLRGEKPIYNVGMIAKSIAAANDELAVNADRLLGELRPKMPARIMVTLPSEAADDPELVQSFADAGMDLARINCAHDDPEHWERMIANVHAAGKRVGRRIRVSMDLAGPKLRTGGIQPGPKVDRARVTRTNAGRILTPAKLWITPLDRTGQTTPAPVPEGLPGRPALAIQVDRDWFEDLAKGDELSMLDARGSKRYMTVELVTPEGVLAIGQQNVYLADGTLIANDYIKTRIYGIKPVEQRIHLEAGSLISLTTDPADTDPLDEVPSIHCPVPEVFQSLAPGSRVLFDDGLVESEVVETGTANGHSYAQLRVTRTRQGGMNLAAHKGISFPGTRLPLPALTAEDREALSFVVRHADIVAASFIHTPEDVQDVLDAIEAEAVKAEQEGGEDALEMAERIRHIGVLLKIETVEAYQQLPAIISALLVHGNSGVMIARGDLAVELGFARMADAPQQIMNAAEAAHVPVVLATQVLETMAKSGLPSRAEITDAAMALGAEAVMLNKGAHIDSAIEILNTMGKTMRKSRHKNRQLMRHIHSWDENN